MSTSSEFLKVLSAMTRSDLVCLPAARPLSRTAHRRTRASRRRKPPTSAASAKPTKLARPDSLPRLSRTLTVSTSTSLRRSRRPPSALLNTATSNPRHTLATRRATTGMTRSRAATTSNRLPSNCAPRRRTPTLNPPRRRRSNRRSLLRTGIPRPSVVRSRRTDISSTTTTSSSSSGVPTLLAKWALRLSAHPLPPQSPRPLPSPSPRLLMACRSTRSDLPTAEVTDRRARRRTTRRRGARSRIECSWRRRDPALWPRAHLRLRRT